MKILFYIGHPAQFHFIKNSVSILEEKGHEVLITYRTKDVLGNLLSQTNFNYINIEEKRINHSGKLGLLKMALRALVKFGNIFRKFKPDICIGLDPIAARYSKLFRIPYVFIAEDDYSIIKKLCDYLFPYSDAIVAPEVCDYSIAQFKKVGYKGYMKLAYLHPNRFVPSFEKVKASLPSDKFVLLRLVSLTAHHDDGIKGIDNSLLDKIIESVTSLGYDVVISSEIKLQQKYFQYQLNTKVEDIHHVLSSASLVICDSQSMAVEAAMLGTPSLRFNDFAGKISVLEELEHKYKLTYGIKTSNPELLLSKINDLLSLDDISDIFNKRRELMLTEKVDVTAFFVWFIENYPDSKKIMIENPDYQNRFI